MAADLLQAASAGCADDPELAAIASLVIRKLNVEHCDILQFASDRRVVVARAEWTNGKAPSTLGLEAVDCDSEVSTTDARVELIQLSAAEAALDVLRTEGTIDRVHVFIPSKQQPTPLGILTVQSSTGLGLSTEERAFLGALGELIGTAIDCHRLPAGDELSQTKQLSTEQKKFTR